MDYDSCTKNSKDLNLSPSKMQKIEKCIYNGAFAFSSPPDVAALNDQINEDQIGVS